MIHFYGKKNFKIHKIVDIINKMDYYLECKQNRKS